MPLSSSPFLKSVAAAASSSFLHPPRLLFFPHNLTLASSPLSSSGGGGGVHRPYRLLLHRTPGWINRARSMPVVRALGSSKTGLGFGFASSSDSPSSSSSSSSSAAGLVKRKGSEGDRMGKTGADSGLDPVITTRAGDGEVVNGFCQDNNNNKDPTPPPRLLTLPTLLTIGRVVAVPLLISTFYMEASWGTTATTSIFLLAAITDWLDGYIARKMKLGTAFGAFLDPVADKLMVAATLVLLCTRPFEVPGLGEVPWLLPVPAIAVIGREITMSAVREWAASQNKKLLEAVAVNNLGKWKTATQMTALTILLLVRDPSLTGQTTLIASGVGLLYVSAGLAVWSLVVYMKKIWKFLLK